MRALAWGLILILLALPLGARAVPGGDPPWWTRTYLDQDHDGIDDSLQALTGHEPISVFLDYATMPTPAQRAALDQAGIEVAQSYHNFPFLVVRALPAQVASLRAMPGVVLVEHDAPMYLMLKDSVPLIGAPQVWKDYGATGKGQTVAIIDDGAFEQHPDFKDKIVDHFDAGGIAPTGPGGITVVAPAGTEGHGTHVAGIAVGGGGQSGGLYKGVAPDASFVNVKVFTAANSTTASVVLKGLDWVLDHMKSDNIRVATMSLGGTPSDGNDAICQGVNQAVEKGLVIVAAAGNAGPGPQTITAPGAAANAITVGAVDKQKRIAGYSSRGPTVATHLQKPDIVAPGSDITSTVPPSTSSVSGLFGQQSAGFYGTLSGTSMATPHVAGVVALMLQVNPQLTPQDVKKILLVTAQDLGPKGRDNDTGFGFVNAIAAVQVAKDPTLLGQPQFASLLATVPAPAKQSPIEQFTYDMDAMVREGKAYVLILVGVGAVGITLVGISIGRMR
ncbi:MAG: serine protease AprX [Thermoplasmata archaeon]|nr:serine protease AprX [Thermoplasmata archaeon]